MTRWDDLCGTVLSTRERVECIHCTIRSLLGRTTNVLLKEVTGISATGSSVHLLEECSAVLMMFTTHTFSETLCNRPSFYPPVGRQYIRK
jgi:hypothetical protein